MISRYIKYGTISSDGRTYINVNYPHIPVNNYDFITIMTKSTDRLDLLAAEYFNNSKLWWLIAVINGLPGDSIVVDEGLVLYIPKEYIRYV